MTYSVDDHIKLKRVSAIAASPDGAWLAVAVERLDRDGAKYVSDLWKVPTDGSAPVQLTRGDTKDTAPCFRHDGAVGFLSNRQPNEVEPDEDSEKRMQVWILPPWRRRTATAHRRTAWHRGVQVRRPRGSTRIVCACDPEPRTRQTAGDRD